MSIIGKTYRLADDPEGLLIAVDSATYTGQLNCRLMWEAGGEVASLATVSIADAAAAISMGIWSEELPA